MTEKQSEITEALATKLEAGTLTVDEFRRGIEALLPHADEKRQDILYLQSNNTSLQGEVIGMTMIEDGQLSEGPPDPKDWPYKTVLEAVCDGAGASSAFPIWHYWPYRNPIRTVSALNSSSNALNLDDCEEGKIPQL